MSTVDRRALDLDPVLRASRNVWPIGPLPRPYSRPQMLGFASAEAGLARFPDHECSLAPRNVFAVGLKKLFRLCRTRLRSHIQSAARAGAERVVFDGLFVRIVDGDDLEFQGQRFRLAGYDAPEIRNLRSKIDRDIERRRGQQAAFRLKTLIGEARSVHIIPWGRTVFPSRQLATLLINGWDVGKYAMEEGWGVDYRERKNIDCGDPDRPFPVLPLPTALTAS